MSDEQQERIWQLEAENDALKKRLADEMSAFENMEWKLKKRVEELEGLLSTDTAEFKSAAFQKIKKLESLTQELVDALDSVLLGWASSDNYQKHYQQAKAVLEKARKVRG